MISNQSFIYIYIIFIFKIDYLSDAYEKKVLKVKKIDKQKYLEFCRTNNLEVSDNINCKNLKNKLYNYLYNSDEIIDISNLDIREIIPTEKKIILDFIILMAPVQNSIENDYSDLGGFIYKDLMNSNEGKYIDYLNGQYYIDYSLDAYEKTIDNDYKSNCNE